MSATDKHTRAVTVVPPPSPTAKRTRTGSAAPLGTIVTAVVPPAAAAPKPARRTPSASHAATIAAPVIPVARPKPSHAATIAAPVIPVAQSQMNTVAVPAVPTMIAGAAPARGLGYQPTMIATQVGPAADEIEIDINDSSIVPPMVADQIAARVRQARAPTFENLAIVAPQRWRWLVVTSAVAAAMIAALLVAV